MLENWRMTSFLKTPSIGWAKPGKSYGMGRFGWEIPVTSLGSGWWSPLKPLSPDRAWCVSVLKIGKWWQKWRRWTDATKKRDFYSHDKNPGRFRIFESGKICSGGFKMFQALPSSTTCSTTFGIVIPNDKEIRWLEATGRCAVVALSHGAVCSAMSSSDGITVAICGTMNGRHLICVCCRSKSEEKLATFRMHHRLVSWLQMGNSPWTMVRHQRLQWGHQRSGPLPGPRPVGFVGRLAIHMQKVLRCICHMHAFVWDRMYVCKYVQI